MLRIVMILLGIGVCVIRPWVMNEIKFIMFVDE